MTTNYAYSSNGGGGGDGSGLLSSSRNQFIDPPGLTTRLTSILPRPVRIWVAELETRVGSIWSRYLPRRIESRGGGGGIRGTLRRVLTLSNLLILLWLFTLWWGERTVYRTSIENCDWGGWEKWPEEASPHHVVFIADPQLVDPHTYPGRPWPLSSLTVFYTDLYLSRSHSLLQRKLRPDTLFFLGDLFDGGREWATQTSSSPEERYKGYGDDFWFQEYDRFSRIFFDRWKEGGYESGSNPRGRKMIASLPGNHDIGFGNGVQAPVRRRFQAYFGDGNRVDVIGNHSFVSVDTASLSSMEQPDPVTGSSGLGSGDGPRPNEDIWAFAETFLDGLKERKGRVAVNELRALGGRKGAYYTFDDDDKLDTSITKDLSAPSPPDFPTILLTHVPLYRAPGTPCGPLRERHPSTTDPLPEKDDRNAIRVSGGYQYQNVLSKGISNELIAKVGPEIAHIYSGDDHDYCEISHREFNGSPKEITVKSMSWAMGVRKPGFQMTSLWNPIDIDSGDPISSSSSSDSTSTLQNHLCLLPDQLSIFIQYAYLFIFTLLILFLRATALVFHPPETAVAAPEFLLPLSQRQHLPGLHKSPSSSSTASSSSSSSSPARVGSRLANRGSISFPGRMPPEPVSVSTSPPPPRSDSLRPLTTTADDSIGSSIQRYRNWAAEAADPTFTFTPSPTSNPTSATTTTIAENPHDVQKKGRARSRTQTQINYRHSAGFRGRVVVATREFGRSMMRVAGVAMVWYLWLLWRW